MKDTVVNRIAEMALVPVVAIDDPSSSTAIAKAFINGGLPCLEITFRTEAAVKVIDSISTKFGNILVGAGTIINPNQAKDAVNAGAQFIVSPGIHHKVIEWCIDKHIPVFPGVATASDIAAALDYGLYNLKFFPAENLGGIRTLKALSAPYKMVKFIPTGGVNISNLEDYLRHPSVLACGGSWLVKRGLVKQSKFGEIERLVTEAVDVVCRIKGAVSDET